MKTLRVFHIIHWNEKCLELYNNSTQKGELYSLYCQPEDGLGHVMPTVIDDCHLTSGVRGSFLVGTLTNDDGRLVELWVLYADARNQTRFKNKADGLSLRWVDPDVFARSATEPTLTYINGYRTNGLWTHEDLMRHLLVE